MTDIQDEHIISYEVETSEKTHVKNIVPTGNSIIRLLKSVSFWFVTISMILSIYIGINVPPSWSLENISLDIKKDADARLFYTLKKDKIYIDNIVPASNAQLTQAVIDNVNLEKKEPGILEEFVFEDKEVNGNKTRLYSLTRAKKHWKLFSLMPAFVAICLCWLTKQPVAALTSGIVAGAFILQWYDFTDQVFLPAMRSENAAGVLLLYLWLLGGLMGIWSRTGAARAFAETVTKYFVRGPKTAKLVAWALGGFFFQGGSISCVLVGTTVKPIADKEGVSHEELSHIVNANATSIATLLPFNAWPGYIQAFIYIAGASFLATEALRVAFFFKCVPLFFFSILQVIFTFLFAIEKSPIVGKKMKAAIKRSRETGQLDAPGSSPLSAKELQTVHVPEGYTPHIIDFILPLGILIGTAIITFITMGSPQIRWAFGLGVVAALVLAFVRGLTLNIILDGLMDGFKGVIIGSLILLLAVTIGQITQALGGGIYIVELLGTTIPFWILPFLLVVLTLFIALSTGSSWGTFAVTFPLALPLAWAVANTPAVQNPMLYMMVCFSCVINGSIWGDQCSPISDCCVLSAMTTGADLMDHAITQTIQSIFTISMAIVAWTLFTLFFC